MNPSLSRRVAKIISAKNVQKMIREEYESFFGELRKADSFNDLSEKLKKTILEAEKSSEARK